MTKRPEWTGNDEFAIRARSSGYVARSAYKLEEMDKKYGLLSGARTVLDLGASPGSWVQYVRRQLPKATIVGIDLNPLSEAAMADISHAIVQDFTDTQTLSASLDQLETGLFDLVLCDAAPKTSGQPDRDLPAFENLHYACFELAKLHCAASATLIIKSYSGLEKWGDRMLSAFKSVRRYKPKASRANSSEFYFIAQR